ncbi:glycosyltransferase family 61 protein [Acinetobacter defluvii]|uniref:glycosyltransferase family 61 protein n=1 Tax=Acinetobacter defluvii TaxID=1871111 RepID=UPI003AF7743E
MINRFIKNYLFEKDFQVPSTTKFVLKWFKKLEIKPIHWLDQLTNYQLETLQEQYYATSQAPIIMNCKSHNAQTLIPTTYLYQFNNALIHTRSSNFLYGLQEDLMVERVLEADIQYCDYATGYLRYHNQTHALIKNKFKKKCIQYSQNTLYLGGNGAYNYYHWLIEIAPKLLLVTPQLLEKYNIEYLILDKSIETTPSLQKILDILLNVQQLKIQIIYKNHDELSLFKNLFYINHRNNFVFNSKEKLSSIHFSCFCPNLIQTLRTACLSQTASSPSRLNFPDRIFLARKAHSVRAYNQDEILNYFVQQGFSELYLEDYSFLEQIQIFNQAKFIIGPSGAAWSNIIFSQAGTQALSWLPKQISEFSAFSTLAHFVGCDMKFILTQSEDVENVHSNYSVDLNQVIELYQHMMLN